MGRSPGGQKGLLALVFPQGIVVVRLPGGKVRRLGFGPQLDEHVPFLHCVVDIHMHRQNALPEEGGDALLLPGAHRAVKALPELPGVGRHDVGHHGDALLASDLLDAGALRRLGGDRHHPIGKKAHAAEKKHRPKEQASGLPQGPSLFAHGLIPTLRRDKFRRIEPQGPLKPRRRQVKILRRIEQPPAGRLLFYLGVQEV